MCVCVCACVCVYLCNPMMRVSLMMTYKESPYPVSFFIFSSFCIRSIELLGRQ